MDLADKTDKAGNNKKIYFSFLIIVIMVEEQGQTTMPAGNVPSFAKFYLPWPQIQEPLDIDAGQVVIVELGIRVKVSTMSTMLIMNNLNVYKTVYKFLKVSTLLIINDLSVYVNDNGNIIALIAARARS